MIVVTLWFAAIHTNAGEYYFKLIGDLPGGEKASYAYGISGDGATVVGKSAVNDRDYGYQGFYWRDDTGIKPLRALNGSTDSVAYEVSGNGGTIVGYSQNSSGGMQATYWGADRKPKPLKYFSDEREFAYSQSLAISTDGKTPVGFAENTDGIVTAARWDAEGNIESLGYLGQGKPTSSAAFCTSADGSYVGGYSTSKKHKHGEAFLWSDGEMLGLGVLRGDKDESSTARAVSNGGTVVGVSTSGIERAFVWSESTGMKALVHDEEQNGALAISADASLIGGYHDGVGPVLWDAAGNERSVKDILDELGIDSGGFDFSYGAVTGFSADGQTITGVSYQDFRYQAWIAHIPEPSALVAVGFLMVLTGRLRRWP